MTFAERLTALRVKKGMSQYEISEMLGIKRPRYNAWEQGLSKPRADMLDKLSELFDVSVDYLLGVSDGKTKSQQPYFALNEKDEKDIGKRIENLMESLETEDSLAFHGGEMSDETRDLLKMALEHGMRIATETAKKKYTPKKYRK